MAVTMTLVVAVLSPEYASILSDTRSTVHGPARIPLMGSKLFTDAEYKRDEEDNLILSSGESLEIDGPHPMLAKVRFSECQMEAFARSGTFDESETYLGLTASMVGLEADERIAVHLAERARLSGVADLEPGWYEGWSVLHVFRAAGRFLAAEFDASPLHLCRRYTRSSVEELRYVAIGSGAQHVQELMRHASLSDAWSKLSERTESSDRLAVDTFWAGIFWQVSRRQADVNALVEVWVREATAPAFRHDGYRTCDAEHAQRVGLHSAPNC